MLDAETKRRIGALGTAALSSLAQRSTMLPPPTRLNTNAELSMGSRPRLSAGAALRLGWNPRAGARGLSLFKSSPIRRMAILRQGLSVGLSAGAAFAARLEPPGRTPGVV